MLRDFTRVVVLTHAPNPGRLNRVIKSGLKKVRFLLVVMECKWSGSAVRGTEVLRDFTEQDTTV